MNRIVSATTYQNMGENRSPVSEIISIERRQKLRYQKNTYFFLCLDANMMTLYGLGWYEIVSPTHALSNHDIKTGGHGPFWRAISISKIACFFSSNLHYIAHSSTRGFSTLRRAHGLMKGQEWLKWMEIVNYGKRNLNRVKFLILTFSTRCERAQRARGHVRTGNFEMLKITWFVLKIVKKWFWEFFNFDARARGHGLSVCYPKPWNLCVLNLVNLWWMVMKIWMIT